MSAAPPRAPFRGLNALYARTLAVDAGGDELALTYDFAGNILRQELTNDGTDTTALRYTHDSWNRLVKVEFEDEEEDLHPRGEYEYNGLNWRTVARADSDTNNSTHALDELRSMYYSHEWRLLEVRVDANYQSSPGINSHVQHVWGERYIDDIVSTRHDPDPSAEDGYETVQFHATDAQFSTVAMLSSSAAVLERVTYSAYGVARHHWLGDVDGDGDADTTDVGLVNAAIGKAIGDVGYRSEFDLNRDGSITLADRGLMSAASALPEGVLSSAAVGNRIGYCGYVFAPETKSYVVRYRWYLPPLGRWGERDPAGYVDGMNLYEYVRSASVTKIDPAGLSERGIELRQDWEIRRRLATGGDSVVWSPRFISNAVTHCGRTRWGPRTRNQCTYGPAVRYAADFTVYDRDRRKGRCDCDPHVIVNLGDGMGAGGACNARFSWPIDCVCRAMPDDAYSACVRGCIRCIFDHSGVAPSLEEHEWCFDQCNPSSWLTGLLAWKGLMEQLDRAIHCCAKRQGVLLGPGTGQPAGPRNAIGPPRVFNCDGCGAGPTRPIDCTGIRIIDGRR